MTLTDEIHESLDGVRGNSPVRPDGGETLRMNRALDQAKADVREGRVFSAEDFMAKVRERWPRHVSE